MEPSSDESQILKASNREIYNSFNTLLCLAQGIAGSYTTIDLRNDSYVCGRINQVDGFMNVVVSDAVFTDCHGNEFYYDLFFVKERNIRYIHVPEEHNCYSCSAFRTLTKMDRTSRNLSFVKTSVSDNNQQHFVLNDYDCIGFDLDNTLCEYNIASLVQMEYNVLSKYLVEKKGYDPNYLYQPLNSDAVDFFQRGLILDMQKGNIIKLDENGVIIKASHGTKHLTEADIKVEYGETKSCELSQYVFKNLTILWDEPMKKKYRMLLDYFDLPASLGFARAVDSREAVGKSNYEDIGSDVLSSLIYMYSRDHFKTEESEFFKQMKMNPQKYINKCPETIINWLKELRKGKRLFLVTGSHIDNASFTASNCLGQDWEDLFDIVVCYARKPGFFEMERPYLSISGLNEGAEIKSDSIQFGRAYSQGNWKDLQTALCAGLNDKPRCLYIGDNLIEDIYTPQKNLLCETVAINEELCAEGFYNSIQHASAEYITSKTWGSFFYDKGLATLTLWGSIINKYAKFCVPSLNYLANCRIDQNIYLPIKNKFVN